MKNLIVMFCFLSLFILGCDSQEAPSSTNIKRDIDYASSKADDLDDIETWSCVDVTSYDRNWNNDMKCTSSTGRKKYTSYEGAKQLESL